MFNDVKQATDRLIARRTKTDLKHFKEILDILEIPYDQVPCIHVTGTNGKGSTINYMAHILQNAGMKVGTFTSPYIICHQDRFCINHEMMSDVDFLDLVNRYYPSIEKYGLSMFEADVLLAFVYFYEKQVDVALIEVGIGGREDKTNILTQPLASVITNVGYDHLAKLGPTLLDVAYQKAGIIKPNAPTFISDMQDDIVAVIEKQARKQHSDLHIVKAPKSQNNLFSYMGIENIDLGEVANYQVKNACLAIEVVKTLYPNISDVQIKQGLYNVLWPGRFEHYKLLDHDVYLDGAHNISAFEVLLPSFENIRHHRQVSVIYAALADKDYQVMANMLKKQGYELCVCQFEDDRALNKKQADELEAKRYYTSIDEAISGIKELSSLVLVCGSLHFISQFRQKLRQKNCIF